MSESEKELGRLEKVELREMWYREDVDFTPWLAREENLALLGETLEINGLELEAREKSIGPFRADILCKDTDSGAWVLIENQLEKTDHIHLGQLLTYASGLEAATIIWIAKNFTEEHRSTLDWLNRITDENFHFFGLELELWRIGDSPTTAPKFNIVSKPNDWSRSVIRAARGELSDKEVMYSEYWKILSEVLNDKNGPVSGGKNHQPYPQKSYPIGRTGFSLYAAITRKNIRVNLYIQGDDAKAFFHLLQEQKQEIEQEIDCPLDWHELPGSSTSRIAVYLGADPWNKKDWQHQHGWLAEKLNEMHRVFHERVKNLDAQEWYQEQESGADDETEADSPS